MMIIKHTLVIMLLAVLSACSSNSEDFENVIAFRNISQGMYSDIKTALRATIRDQETWSVVWSNHMGHAITDKPLTFDVPAIDFSTNMLFAFYLGEESNAGSKVSIDSVVAYDDYIEVHIVRKPSDIPIENLTTHTNSVQPYHVVQMPFSKKPVIYVFSDGVAEFQDDVATRQAVP